MNQPTSFVFPKATFRQKVHRASELAKFQLYKNLFPDVQHQMGEVKLFAYASHSETCPSCDARANLVARGEITEAEEQNYQCTSEDFKQYHELLDEAPTLNNLIVTNGKNLALDRLFNLGSAVAITSVGVGTDSTAAAVGQTQLNPSVAGSVLLQTADAGTARSSQTVTITATFGTGVANFQWNEIALFNGNTNGTSTMFNRIIIGPFTKSSAVSIVAQIQITQA